MRRGGLHVTEQYDLARAFQRVNGALDTTCYHVGSSVFGEWRDVDVRAILDDAEYDRRFGGADDFRRLFEVAVSRYTSDLTRLPIDFQVQRRTDANTEFSGCSRSALIVVHTRKPSFFDDAEAIYFRLTDYGQEEQR